MDSNTNYTPYPDDNKLGIADKNLINEIETEGIVAAELFTFSFETDTEISTQLICQIHNIAFTKLYYWAGKWRDTLVTVGQLTPPPPENVLQLMYQFVDNLNYKINSATNQEFHIECLVYAHYEFIKIHPFNNGNGRTGRILMNFIALKFGYQPLELYHRIGNNREIYINAMKEADFGNFQPLTSLITKELIVF